MACSQALTTHLGSKADELAVAVFLSPGPAGLLLVWHFAGPSCCFKALAVARGAGPARRGQGGLLGEPSALPWEEWWPSLGRSILGPELRRYVPDVSLSLDRAWVAIHARPQCVNAVTAEGKPLILAVQRGRRDIAELLRCCGAHLSRRVYDELLFESAGRGDAHVIRLLLYEASGFPRVDPWASPNARPTRHGGTPLDAAVGKQHRHHQHAEAAELLRNAGGRHSIHWAAKHAISEDVEAWLRDGACADERDGSGATPLWLAVKGPPEIQSSKTAVTGCSSRSFCVAKLLEAGAAVNVLPISMETPLLIASARGDLCLCEQLLAAQADPTLADRSGRTPLKCAANDSVRQLLVAALPEEAMLGDLEEADSSDFIAGCMPGHETRSSCGMDRPPQLRVMTRPQLLAQDATATPQSQHPGCGWHRPSPPLHDSVAAPSWPHAATGLPFQVGHAGIYNPAGSAPAAGYTGLPPMWWTMPPAQAAGPPAMWGMPNMAPRWNMPFDMAAVQGQPPFS